MRIARRFFRTMTFAKGVRIAIGFVLAALFLSAPAYAQALNTLTTTIDSDGSALLGGADTMFTTFISAMLVLVLLYHIAKTAYTTRNPRAVVDEGIKQSFEVGLPYLIIISLYPLLASAESFALSLFGFTSAVTGGVAYSPAQIVTKGVTLSFGLLGSFFTSLFQSFTAQPSGNIFSVFGNAIFKAIFMGEITMIVFLFGLLLLIVAIITSWAFAMLAAELLLAKIQAAITLPFAKVFMALQIGPLQGLGSSGLGAVLAILVRYAVIAVMVAIVMGVASAWQADAASAGTLVNQIANPLQSNGTFSWTSYWGTCSGALKLALSFMFASLILKHIVGQVGGLADAVLTGRSVFSGAAGVAAAAAPVTMAAGAASGALAGGAMGGAPGAVMGAATGAMNGGKSAVSQAMIGAMRK